MKLATHNEIARLIQETPDRTEQLVKKLGMPRERGRKYNVSRVVHWVIDWYRQRIAHEKANRYVWELNELADLFHREPRSINKMAKDRGLPRAGRGKYEIKPVVRWFIDDLERQLDIAKAGGEDAAAAKARLIRSQADQKEIEVAKLRGEAVNIDDFTRVVTDGLSITRQQMLGLKKRLAPALEGLETVAEREAIIDTYIHELLTDLATVPDRIQRLAEVAKASAAESVGDLDAAGKAHRRRARRRASRAKRRKRQ